MSNKTYPEIMNQYAAIAKTREYVLQHGQALREFYSAHKFRRLVVIGSGSSFDVSMAVECTANLKLNIPAVSVPAGDLMLHMPSYEPVLRGALLLVLSRSGSTDEIVHVIRRLHEMQYDAKVLSVVCVEASRVSELSDYVLEMPWAFDESVCQTRSVSAMYAAAQMVLSLFSGREEIDRDIKTIAENGDAYLAEIEPILGEIARETWEKVCVLADGEANGIAEEAALAFNEICYTPSVCKHVLDVRHGPIVLVDAKTLVLLHLNGDGFEYQKALAEDIIKKGARVILYSDMPLPEKIEGARAAISFGKPLCASAAALPLLPIAQLISYHNAVARGFDPDQPLGLDAWIGL